MIRLRNAATGVVVSVSDDKADRLSSVWSRVESSEPVEASGRVVRAAKKTGRK